MRGTTIVETALGDRPNGDLVVVADAHLGANDPELRVFLHFLAERAGDTAALVLLGDIFALWLGAGKFTLPHHHEVLASCTELRKRGVRVIFVEGNREYGAVHWRGRAFDAVCDGMVVAPWGGERWYLAHGDLLDPGDTRGRFFRRVARFPPLLGLFRALPGQIGVSIGERIERLLRHRNLARKTSIPKRRLAGYAEWLARRGFDAGVIGHIHVEMQLALPAHDGATRRLFVLPDWRSGRRYLRVWRDGRARFESFGEPLPVMPAVVRAREADGAVLLVLDREVELAPGDPVAISSGHGPQVRRGRVREIRPAGSESDHPELLVALDAGPPVQVGDRLRGPVSAGSAEEAER